ncbi:MAG: type II toxin-antitoxin system RelE/ParE family toxin [Phormidesmis sp.]
MTYRIIISKSVTKQLDKLPDSITPRVISTIKSLSQKPRPDGVKKLKGYRNQYRVRVGSYRIRYEIEDELKNVKILQCKHRKDVYKDKD